MAQIYHYTNRSSFNVIHSQQTWTFLASRPPGEHPMGAYFTNLDQDTPLLARKLGIPREKLEFVLCFADVHDLRPLRGEPARQIYAGPK